MTGWPEKSTILDIPDHWTHMYNMFKLTTSLFGVGVGTEEKGFGS